MDRAPSLAIHLSLASNGRGSVVWPLSGLNPILVFVRCPLVAPAVLGKWDSWAPVASLTYSTRFRDCPRTHSPILFLPQTKQPAASDHHLACFNCLFAVATLRPALTPHSNHTTQRITHHPPRAKLREIQTKEDPAQRDSTQTAQSRSPPHGNILIRVRPEGTKRESERVRERERDRERALLWILPSLCPSLLAHQTSSTRLSSLLSLSTLAE